MEYLKSIGSEYDKWNTWNKYSVEYILDCAIGNKGSEAVPLAITILRQFMTWYETQKDNYLPEHDFEVMYSKNCLKHIIDMCVTNNGVFTIDEKKVICKLLDDDEQHLSKKYSIKDNLINNGISL